MTEPDDITNKVLGRFLSAEVITLFIVGGIAWGALTTEVDALDKEVVTIKSDQKETHGDLNEVKQKLGVLETNQEHFKEKFKEQEKSVNKILEILTKETAK